MNELGYSSQHCLQERKIGKWLKKTMAYSYNGIQTKEELINCIVKLKKAEQAI